MATTVYSKVVKAVDVVETEIKVSTLTAGLEVDLEHSGPSGVRPQSVTCEVVTCADDTSPLLFTWVQDDDDTTNDEIRVRFDTVAGGDLTGAVVLVRCRFMEAASGGLNPP